MTTLDRPFDYNLVFSTQTSGFSRFDPFPSINSQGNIAVVGQSDNGTESLLVSDGITEINQISPLITGATFNSEIEINDRNQVVAIENTGSRALRVWDVETGDNRTYAISDFSNTLFDFSSVFKPSINNNDQVAFIAQGFDSTFRLTTLENASPSFDPTNTNRQYSETPAINIFTQPEVADNGKVVAETNLGSIGLFNYNGLFVSEIAANSSDFSDVGASPGISDNSQAVAFYGDLNNSSNLELDAGPGIFLSLDPSVESGTARDLIRLAEPMGPNGELDLGEDSNNNGVLDPGEDIASIAEFVADERVDVSFDPNTNVGTVAYLAEDGMGRTSAHWHK